MPGINLTGNKTSLQGRWLREERLFYVYLPVRLSGSPKLTSIYFINGINLQNKEAIIVNHGKRHTGYMNRNTRFLYYDGASYI